MHVSPIVLLAVASLCLGACPFSLWIGRLFLRKDIRDYGDGNPGAANVFRSGGRRAACLALVLDVAKGSPFVLLAHSFFVLPETAVMVVALSAITGSAFSPLLRFRGGKSVAITYGVLLALPDPMLVWSTAVFMFLAFLFIKNHSWIVVAGLTGALAFLIAAGAIYWEVLFMLGVLMILIAKHHRDLRTAPQFEARLVNWLRLKRYKA